MSWPMGTLNELADVISGYAFKSTWFGEGTAKVIRIGDLQNGIIEVENAATIDDSVNQIKPQFKIQRGDILMALSGATVGKIAVADEKAAGCYLNQRVAIIRSKKPESLDYLKYVFSGDYLSKLLMSAGGAAQPNLSPKDLANMEIPLPPLAEQKRIAAILDKADAIRRKRQQAIQLADDFLRAVFLEMFGDPVTNPKGWEVKSCSEISKQITVGVVVKPASYYVDEGVPAIRSLNIKEYGIDETNFVYFSEETNKTVLSKSRVYEGDLVIVRSGQPGKTAVITKKHDGINAIDVLIFRPIKEVVDSAYLAYFFNSGAGKNIVLAEERGQIQKHLNVTSLNTALIPIPPINKQREFVKLLDSFRKKFSRNNSFFHDELFLSASKKAFSGQL